MSRTITVSPFAGTIDDYIPQPSDGTQFDATVTRMDVVPGSGGTTIAGLKPGADGQVVMVRNCGSGDVLTLENQAATSNAAWQFEGPDSIRLAQHVSVEITYRADLAKWVMR